MRTEMHTLKILSDSFVTAGLNKKSKNFERAARAFYERANERYALKNGELVGIEGNAYTAYLTSLRESGENHAMDIIDNRIARAVKSDKNLRKAYSTFWGYVDTSYPKSEAKRIALIASGAVRAEAHKATKFEKFKAKVFYNIIDLRRILSM